MWESGAVYGDAEPLPSDFLDVCADLQHAVAATERYSIELERRIVQMLQRDEDMELVSRHLMKELQRITVLGRDSRLMA